MADTEFNADVDMSFTETLLERTESSKRPGPQAIGAGRSKRSKRDKRPEVDKSNDFIWGESFEQGIS